MNSKLIDDFITAERFERYLLACKQITGAALDLYESNLLISKCFYPVLSILEVALRNRVNAVMTKYFNDGDWILNEKSRFMSHPSLAGKFIMRTQVEAVERMLLQKNLNVKLQIITELTLAFWVRLFQADHYKLLRAEPMKAFPHLPKGINRDDAHQMLKSILDFRNRVYHNEPICFGVDKRTNESIIDLSKLQEVYENLNTLLFWLGGNDLLHWVQDRFDKESLIREADRANKLITHFGKGRPFTLVRMP
jgi:hypothetical protein